MKGIHIPPACAMEEIRLNIQNVEQSQSNQVRTIKSGMLWPKRFSFKICLLTVRIIFWTTSYFVCDNYLDDKLLESKRKIVLRRTIIQCI